MEGEDKAQRPVRRLFCFSRGAMTQVGGGRKGVGSEGLRGNRVPRQGRDWAWKLEQLSRGRANFWDGFSGTQFSLGADSMPCL